MFKVNNKDVRGVRCLSCVIVVNFEDISRLALVFLLLTLNMQFPVNPLTPAFHLKFIPA